MHFDSALIAELEEVAHAMADAGRVAVTPYFRSQTLRADNKAAPGAFDPVTEADRAVERAMRQVLAERRPNDGIEGEEEADTPSRSGLTWVIDPIDGTRAFLAGAPVWGMLIAVNAGAEPVLGLIDQPHIGERFIGTPSGAVLNHGGTERVLRTRSAVPLSQAVLISTMPEVGSIQERSAFETVRDAVRLTRYGLDCYGYALVALGLADLVIEAGLEPFDIQGPMAVVQAAGGIVTNWQGGPAHRGGQVIAAANEGIHAAALKLLNS